MHGMTESPMIQYINAQCHCSMIYLHRLSGVRYSAIYESPYHFALTPIHGASRHVSAAQLADAKVWQLLT
jgi:hypothetical protein